MNMTKNLIASFGTILAITMLAGGNAQNASGLQGRTLLEALQKGGFVLYFRHTRTDWSQAPREGDSGIQIRGLTDRAMLQNCELQRNLKAEGREDARAIGRFFQEQRIPVGDVLASPFCRAREHATLSFNRFSVNWEVFDSYSLPKDGAERNRLKAGLNRLLSTAPKAGTNTVIIAHVPNFEDATGESLEEGEAAIVSPSGDAYRIVARVKYDGWNALLEAKP